MKEVKEYNLEDWNSFKFTGEESKLQGNAMRMPDDARFDAFIGRSKVLKSAVAKFATNGNSEQYIKECVDKCKVLMKEGQSLFLRLYMDYYKTDPNRYMEITNQAGVAEENINNILDTIEASPFAVKYFNQR